MTMLMKTLSLFPTAYLLRLSYKLCCLEYLLCAFALSAARFRRAVLNIVFLNSKMYRIVMPDSFLGHPDPSMSFLCYILFTGYLLNRGTNTNCQAPIHFSELLHLHTSSADTRVFRIPFFPTKSSGQRSFFYQAQIVLNQLPVFVRHSTADDSSKSSWKKVIFSKTFLQSHCSMCV